MDKKFMYAAIDAIDSTFADILEDSSNAGKLGINYRTFMAYKSYLKAGRLVSYDKKIEVVLKYMALEKEK